MISPLGMLKTFQAMNGNQTLKLKYKDWGNITILKGDGENGILGGAYKIIVSNCIVGYKVGDTLDNELDALEMLKPFLEELTYE